MTDSSNELDNIRVEIDRIDTALHDLLMQRASLVQRVGNAKRAQPGVPVYVRPGREADVLRNLINRHDGPLPKATVARIWREVISAACMIQTDLHLAVYAPENEGAVREAVRNQFGVLVPVTWCTSVQRVFQEVTDKGAIGVMPAPSFGADDRWWPFLLTETAQKVRVVGVAPFFVSGSGQTDLPQMTIVGDYAPEPSSDDVSMVVVSGQPTLSRARLSDKIAESGLVARQIDSTGDDHISHHLLEIDGFVAKTDPRLAELEAAMDGALDRISVIGAYARPLGALDSAG